MRHRFLFALLIVLVSPKAALSAMGDASSDTTKNCTALLLGQIFTHENSFRAISPAIAEAEAFVTNLENNFDSVFSTSGFNDRLSLQNAIRAYSEEAKEASITLEKEDIEFAMGAPTSAREGILTNGFQNQRETKSSFGRYDPLQRDRVEAWLTGTPENKYAQLPAELKPKYGYLKASNSSKVKPAHLDSYGEDSYIFKNANVRNRVTWTMGDSYELLRFIDENKPRLADDWRQVFVPWRDRDLMVFQLLEHYKKGIGFRVSHEPFELYKFKDMEMKALVAPIEPIRPPLPRSTPLGSDPEFKSKLRTFMTSSDWRNYQARLSKWKANSSEYRKYLEALGLYRANLRGLEKKWMRDYFKNTTLEGFSTYEPINWYLEIQYFGPIDLKDVSAFEYRTNPPRGAFLKALNHFGIEIRKIH